MSTIQLKRGEKSNLPSTALSGEPLVTLDSHELFIGDSSNIVEPVKTQSENIIDKGDSEGVAELDIDKNVVHNIKTDNLFFSSANEVVINLNQNIIISSLSKNEFRLLKYLINVSDQETGEFYSSEIIAHHNGSIAEFSEYGIIGEETVSFNVSIGNSNIQLLGSSSKDSQVVRVIITAIRF